MTKFRPGLPLTICSILALAVLIFLGTWQARKVGPKTALLTTISKNMDARAIPLAETFEKPDTYLYRRVTVQAERAGSPVKVFGTNRAGESGYYLYAPIIADSGQVIIANFGWVPMRLEKLPSLPSGPQDFSGVLVASAAPGSMTPLNEAEKGNWYLADVAELAEHFGYSAADVYPLRFFVDAEEGARSLPLGGQVRVDIPNDHFQYALTWYGLALGLVGVYLVFGFKRGRNTP